MRAFLCLALLATGCEQILGIDDFTATGAETDAGSSSDSVRFSGKVTDVNKAGVAGVGVEMITRDGIAKIGEAEGAGDGTFSFEVPVVANGVDGYIHFAHGGYRDTYFHLPKVTSVATTVNITLLADADIAAMATSSGATMTAGRGFAFVTAIQGGAPMGNTFVGVNGDSGAAEQVVRYINASDMVQGDAVMRTYANGKAAVFNMTDDVYLPFCGSGTTFFGDMNRKYVVEPNTVAYMTCDGDTALE